VSWSRIRGHDALVQSFRSVFRRGRLAHAYLFTGPAGVGKQLFARELAKALLCENAGPENLAACDECPSCHQVDAGSHPDFFSARRPEDKLEFPVAVIRELCRNLSMKPARGGYKIAILDNADDLNEESANCFLKTLEEPPPRSVLILIATNPEMQLWTIVSRCQVIRFAPLHTALVADILRQQGKVDRAVIDRLARLSGGSPAQAQALADPALWEFRRTLLQALTQSPLDTVALARQWIQFVEEAGKDGASQRPRASLVLRFLIDFLNGALRFSVGAKPELAEPDDRRFLEALNQQASPDLVLELLELCLDADRQIDRRVQLVLILEALVDALGQKIR
jgi:DNA polymerase-3 subunit delta'